MKNLIQIANISNSFSLLPCLRTKARKPHEAFLAISNRHHTYINVKSQRLVFFPFTFEHMRMQPSMTMSTKETHKKSRSNNMLAGLKTAERIKEREDPLVFLCLRIPKNSNTKKFSLLFSFHTNTNNNNFL